MLCFNLEVATVSKALVYTIRLLLMFGAHIPRQPRGSPATVLQKSVSTALAAVPYQGNARRLGPSRMSD